ncbi:MAG: hypothetical protein IPM42_21240 [Saprospiraceae bacterium]|nr:hypothetical protein [Saprospiraceae bacterium]
MKIKGDINVTDLSGNKFNIIRGDVINKTNKIEHLIDTILISYFKPSNENTFREILLNSSILPTAGKIKVLNNIPDFNANISQDLITLSNIRNAFAHADIKININIQLDNEKNCIDHNTEEKIVVLKNSGKSESKLINDYFNEFNTLYDKVKKYLIDFKSIIVGKID